MTLDELETGQTARILRVGGGGRIRRRLVDMGVVKGTPIEVIKVAPLGDPIEVKIKGYNLTLRKKEAANITIEPEES
jgi:Fe2+ transport system protein FeoA